jgi:hypothetical protein
MIRAKTRLNCFGRPGSCWPADSDLIELLRRVAKALTSEEHDEAWSKLHQLAPKQAEWLPDSSPPHQWRQQSEMLLLGRPTLNWSIYNVANAIATANENATLLFSQQCSE